MTSVRLHSSLIRAGAVFKVPILSWTAEVPSRFFRALYGALNDMLYIQPTDFVAPAVGEDGLAVAINEYVLPRLNG